MAFGLRFFRGSICALVLLAFFRFGAVAIGAGFPIHFRTERPGFVSINVYAPDGVLVRPLLSRQWFAAGEHNVQWDAKRAFLPADIGEKVPPGEYTWRGLFHEGIGLKLRGWACNDAATPCDIADEKGGWGGDTGVPSAVAADDKWVYLGWSLADRGKAVLACDLEGCVQWGHRRADGSSGCKALAVDDGVVYVLGGLKGVDAEGGAVHKLKAKDGTPVPWPSGALDLKVASFWPADATTKPDRADAMAVRYGRIYLTFTASEFMAVLDAKTGEYLQTVVGAPPGLIDVAPTKTDLPDAPGKLVDADFALISLGGGVLGKVLFAHDPPWVITSELTPMERDVRISALTVIGDGAKFHQHTAFVGLDAPFHQVQARPLLDTEGYTWAAGKPGGRPLVGPWQPDTLRNVRGVALDAKGRLWVAEGDAFPKRFSVWDTSGQQGKLVREFFGPAEYGFGGAINPLDPDLMFAQGCEWRIDNKTGRASCLGVVTREPVVVARYGVGENGHAYLVTSPRVLTTDLRIFERVGEGDYKLRTRIFPANALGEEALENATATKIWSDENGDGEMQNGESQLFNDCPVFYAPQTTQDLTLTAETSSERSATNYLLRVAGWSGCGAPKYDAAKRVILPLNRGQVSADGKKVLTAWGMTECYDLSNNRKLWSLPIPDGVPGSFCGSAYLPAPIRNVWVLLLDRHCRLLNEDGFELASFFESGARGKVARPGMEMSRVGMPDIGSITQGADGKLYLQAGESAYWNLEVTGLEKVKALPGGKITVPAAK